MRGARDRCAGPRRRKRLALVYSLQWRPAMALALSTTADTTAPKPIGETDLDRVLKLIPTDVVAIYAAAIAIMPEVTWRYFPLTAFLVGVALVPFILFVDGRATGKPARGSQYAVRIVAFAVWAAAMAWPFGFWTDPGDLRWALALAVPLVPVVGERLLRAPRPN